MVLFIIIRILFAACMVFIIGTIFGGWGKKPVLRGIAKTASILLIVLFIATNILFMRLHFGHFGHYRSGGHWQGCDSSWQERVK